MAYTPVNSLPTAPSRQDDGATFASKADTWVASLQGWTDEVNASGTYIDGVGTQVDLDKTAAETARAGAETAQGLAEDAQAAAELAQTGAETAETNAYNYIATIPAGTLNDAITTTTNTWSSSKIDADKADTIHSHAISDVTNLQTTLNGKQATLVSGSNIRTLNGTSLLGSGNITTPQSYTVITSGTLSGATSISTPSLSAYDVVIIEVDINSSTGSTSPTLRLNNSSSLYYSYAVVRSTNTAVSANENRSGINCSTSSVTLVDNSSLYFEINRYGLVEWRMDLRSAASSSNMMSGVGTFYTAIVSSAQITGLGGVSGTYRIIGINY